MILDLANGLDYIHSSRIAHLDLNPNNVPHNVTIITLTLGWKGN